MNAAIGTEVVKFDLLEYINRIFFAVQVREKRRIASKYQKYILI
jgi:hypothetical protein